MTGHDIARIVQGRFICGEEDAQREVHFACSADLMSDVLTLTHENVLFITGLVTAQTIRTAIVADIRIVLIVRGKAVPESVAELARSNDVILIASEFSMFRASGELFAAGLAAIY